MVDNKIDVIIPVYNQEKRIEKCIKSILNQTFKNWHLILVDDGSVDRSLEICRKYETISSAITVINQDNHGVAAARNEGLKYLRGAYVAFIDSDDYIEKTYFENLVNDNSGYDLIVSGNAWVDDKGNLIKENKPATFKSVQKQEIAKYIHQKQNFKYFTSPWSKLFRTSIIQEQKIQFRHLNYGEDTCFVFDYIYYANGLKVNSDIGYKYYISSDSLSRKVIENIWLLLKDINEYCRKDFYNKYDTIWNYMYLRIIKVALGNYRSNYEMFIRQFCEIRKDGEYKYLKIHLYNKNSEKVLCFFIKRNLKLPCYLAYKFMVRGD